MELLRAEELEKIEREYASGLPARVVISVFTSKGVRLSEATFRKYVQAGLLPRSRRVGTKGKHRGSLGLYPASVVRRVNAIRHMMAQGMTLEDIKGTFIVFRNHLDVAHQALTEAFDGFEQRLDSRERISQLRSLRVQTRQLFEEISRFGSVVTARPGVELANKPVVAKPASP